VQVHHQRDQSLVVQRDDAGDDPRGPQRQQAGVARRELSDAARPAGQDVQVAVDVDDLDQMSGAEFVEQVGRAERGSPRPSGSRLAALRV
jgi:hypothetical protein